MSTPTAFHVCIPCDSLRSTTLPVMTIRQVLPLARTDKARRGLLWADVNGDDIAQNNEIGAPVVPFNISGVSVLSMPLQTRIAASADGCHMDEVPRTWRREVRQRQAVG